MTSSGGVAQGGTTALPAFIPCEIDQISRTLDRLFGATGGEGVEKRRSGSANMLVPIKNPAEMAAIFPLVDLLSRAYPSRFFFISVDERATKPSIGVAAYCHFLSKSEQTCSELVQIFLPTASDKALTSIVRSQLLTGCPTGALLMDPGVSIDLIEELSTLCELFLFDSALHDSVPGWLATVAKLRAQLVDLQWIGLATWREQLRTACDRSEVRSALSRLSGITVKAESHDPLKESSSALLMAGWLINRLGLEFAKRRGEALIFTPRANQRSPLVSGAEAAITLLCTQNKALSRGSRLQEVVLDFKAEKELPGGTVTLHRAVTLDTSVALGPAKARFSRPFESESPEGRLERYFLIGESILQYSAALKTAFDLRRAITSQ